MLSQLFDKEEIKIIVTDSGLGGFFIAADILEKLKQAKIFRKVDVLFFNSSFDNKSGYNVIQDNSEKVSIFNRALNSMEYRYKPDIILIGCNTLSVIYPETPFSTQTKIPVIGIVETGVDLIMDQINIPDYNIIMFGTDTTIGKGIHKNLLIEKGVKTNRFYGVSCFNLADKIEEDFKGDETRQMIARRIEHAISQLQIPELPLIVSLNCTHYGYVASIFREEFIRRGVTPKAIVNPNSSMTNFLLPQDKFNRYQQTVSSIEVVCKVTIFPDVMNSICELIEAVSSQSVKALRNYKHDKTLF